MEITLDSFVIKQIPHVSKCRQMSLARRLSPLLLIVMSNSEGVAIDGENDSCAPPPLREITDDAI